MIVFWVSVAVCCYALFFRRRKKTEPTDHSALINMLCEERLKVLEIRERLSSCEKRLDLTTRLYEDAVKNRPDATEKVEGMGADFYDTVIKDMEQRELRAKAVLRVVLRRSGSGDEEIDALMESIDTGVV